MSSRVSFAVYDVNGLKTDLIASNFTIQKNGVTDATLVVTPNNDGTYYYTITVSAKYTVKVNGTSQDEMTDIYIPTNDILIQGDVDDVTVEFASGKLKVKSAGIDTLQLKDSAVTTVKLAADAVDDTKIADDAVKKEHINSDVAGDGIKQGTGGVLEADFDSADFEIDTNSKLAVKDRSNFGGQYIQESKSLSQNMKELDTQVQTLQSASNLTSYRTIFDESKVAAVGTGSIPGAYTEWEENGASYVQKIKVFFVKRSTDTKLILNIKADRA